jgi:hypothetical protein
VNSSETSITEIFSTSEGVIVARETDKAVYEPYCLIDDGVVCVPVVGGEWIPCVTVDFRQRRIPR